MTPSAILLLVVIFVFLITSITSKFLPTMFGTEQLEVSSGVVVPHKEKPEIEYTPDELLVKFKPGTSFKAQESLLQAFNAKVKYENPQIQVKVLSVDPEAQDAIQKALSHNRIVKYVEKNRIFSPAEIVPNDPYYSNQWHLSKIQAAQAWEISQGSPSIIITICDSGVDISHPDLAPKLLSGYNFYDKNDNVTDVYGHGTKVAGTAAAVTDNSLGVAAIGWQTKIIPVRVTDTSGYAYTSTLASCLIYGADHETKSAVMSFAIYGGNSPTLTNAAKYLYDKGGLAVAAGGNDGALHSDPDNNYIISVSATNSNDERTSYSSFGPYIDLSAPGSSIYTTIRGGNYGAVSGTSFSAPLTGGLITLIFSTNLSLSPDQVLEILKQSSKDLGTMGYDEYYGWGRIDAYQALLKASGLPTPITTTTISIYITTTTLPPITTVPIVTSTSTTTTIPTTTSTAIPTTLPTTTTTIPFNITVDTTPPIATITYPINGSQVSATTTINVNASDNIGVTKVELYKDGVLFASENFPPYSFIWDTTSDSNGYHTLVAKAYDAAGNIGTSNKVTIFVNNIVDNTPPKVSILSPDSGATVSGLVMIYASAYDSSGVQRVDFYVNNKFKSSVYSSPYIFKWNTRSVKDGSYTIQVKAYDNFGNVGQSSVIVTVANRK